jgi:cation transport regulator
MPYNKTQDLPDSVRRNLPEHAQKIFVEAFNSAWDEYASPDKRRGNESREEVAMKVAWAAVKHEYKKDEKTGKWERKEGK